MPIWHILSHARAYMMVPSLSPAPTSDWRWDPFEGASEEPARSSARRRRWGERRHRRAGQTEHSSALSDVLKVATASLLGSPDRLLIPESILGHRPTSFLPADAELLCRMVLAADGRSCVCITRSHWCAHRPRCSSRLDDTLTTHTLRRSTVFSRAGTAAVPRCVST